MIECRDISFSYPDGNLALDRVSARFTSGERVALVGQNGAGKSTLSKLLNGLITPSSGEVFLDETSLTRMRSDQIAQRMIRSSVRAYVMSVPTLWNVERRSPPKRSIRELAML